EKNGAKEIYVFATHPVFSENASVVLETCNAKKIFVTDSIAVPESKQFKKLEVLSVASLIAETLQS
ncbi:MAG: ribose-phosphate pyrophosphokinase, partial [Bacteroidia bacterium]